MIPVRGVRYVAALALLALLVLAPSVLPSTARAQEDEPSIEVTATFSPPAASIGDRVTLDVRVRHPADVVITAERPSIADADVLGDAQPVTQAQPDGTVVTSYSFRYQLFALGEVTAGQLRVRWLREDGTAGVYVTRGPVLTVVSVRAPGDQDLRPLKPPVSVAGAPPAWVRPAAAGAVVLLLAAGLLAAVAWWRRLRVVPEPEVEPHTAEERARERLDALRRGRLEDEAAYQAYYGTISLAVRDYLGERFRFNADALTTSELERRMTSHGVDRWQARLVGGLLDRCDRAVYARDYPDPASADHDLTVAYEIVELSRPRPSEDVEAEAVMAS